MKKKTSVRSDQYLPKNLKQNTFKSQPKKSASTTKAASCWLQGSCIMTVCYYDFQEVYEGACIRKSKKNSSFFGGRGCPLPNLEANCPSYLWVTSQWHLRAFVFSQLITEISMIWNKRGIKIQYFTQISFSLTDNQYLWGIDWTFILHLPVLLKTLGEGYCLWKNNDYKSYRKGISVNYPMIQM